MYIHTYIRKHTNASKITDGCAANKHSFLSIHDSQKYIYVGMYICIYIYIYICISIYIYSYIYVGIYVYSHIYIYVYVYVYIYTHI